jgi:hypothetical protein
MTTVKRHMPILLFLLLGVAMGRSCSRQSTLNHRLRPAAYTLHSGLPHAALALHPANGATMRVMH